MDCQSYLVVEVHVVLDAAASDVVPVHEPSTNLAERSSADDVVVDEMYMMVHLVMA